MNRPYARYFIAPTIFFILINIHFIFFSVQFERWGFDVDVLLLGNVVLYLVTLISFFMGVSGLKAENPHKFFRMVYGSFMVKLLVIAGAAFAYIMSYKGYVNKASLIFCAVLYILYTVLEVGILMKLAKNKE